MDAPSGAGAVTASKMARAQKEKATIAEAEDSISQRAMNLKRSGTKTFYLENGVWIDSEFREEARIAEVSIVFGSEAYFDLVAREPAIGQYLAVGEQVVLVWKGKVYRLSK